MTPLDREAVARIIDPEAFTGHAEMTAYFMQKVDEQTARRYADRTYRSDIESALAKADQILVLSRESSERLKQALSIIEGLSCWVKAALDCKSWSWDADQHEAATYEHQQAADFLVLSRGGDGSFRSHPSGVRPTDDTDQQRGASLEWREVESGVTVSLTARHLDPHLDEGWHVHTFDVTIWRDGEPFTDGRSPRGALTTLLESIAPVAADGVRELPPGLWSNEAILRAVGTLANVTEAHVSRPGFRARARR